MPCHHACNVLTMSSCCCCCKIVLFASTPLFPSLKTPLVLIFFSNSITMSSSREETHWVTSSTVTHSGSYGTQLLSAKNENRVRWGHGIKCRQEPGMRVRLEPRRRGVECSNNLRTTSAVAGLVVSAIVAAVLCFPGARAMSAGEDHSCAVISDGRVKVGTERVCEGVFEQLLLKICFRFRGWSRVLDQSDVDHGCRTNQMYECKVFRV